MRLIIRYFQCTLPAKQELHIIIVKPMKTIIINYIIAILILCNAFPIVAQQAQDFFPLSEGTYWVYKGTVKWTDSVNKVKEQSITLKMEVIKRFKNGPYEIALMKGHPKDLCWYKPDEKYNLHNFNSSYSLFIWSKGK